jgi:hypothetical protein
MPAPKLAVRARPQDVDRFVGARIRQRRILLGPTQQQMAELIGVTYQQAQVREGHQPCRRRPAVLNCPIARGRGRLFL